MFYSPRAQLVVNKGLFIWRKVVPGRKVINHLLKSVYLKNGVIAVRVDPENIYILC